MARYETDLRAFIREYQDMEAKTRPIPVVNGEDLSDLPPELLSELSATKTDELETQIVTVVNAAGQCADIDTILIHLYRKFNVVQTRRFIQNKLWRMTQKEILHSVEGKKGLYSTRPDEAHPEHEEEDKSLDDVEIIVIDPDDEIPF